MPGDFGFRYAAASYWRLTSTLAFHCSEESNPPPPAPILCHLLCQAPSRDTKGNSRQPLPLGEKVLFGKGMPGYVRCQLIQQVCLQMQPPQVWGTKYHKTVTWKDSHSPGTKNLN